jgi:hypothetical protein
MARNVTTFNIGNRVGLKLTPEVHELFVATIRITGRISIMIYEHPEFTPDQVAAAVLESCLGE